MPPPEAHATAVAARPAPPLARARDWRGRRWATAWALSLAALTTPPAAANGADAAQAVPLAHPTPTLAGRALFLHAEAQGDDDPRAALAALRQGPADEPAQHRAWRALALAEVQTRLEDEAAAGQALAQAAQWMAHAPVPDAEWQVRFELQSLLTLDPAVPNP